MFYDRYHSEKKKGLNERQTESIFTSEKPPL